LNKILTVLLLSSSLPLLAQPTVNGNVISWSGDGWYEVQNAGDYTTVCSGGTSCEVGPGIYKVINHSTGEKFRGIEVGGANPEPPGVSSVSVNGNVISWPDDGWYQVQNASDYTSICEGGLTCVVEPGVYNVTNHSTGEKFKGIEVSGNGDQSKILVSFDITVPAYQSNALRLELEWGDVTLTAAWVGDEFWSASGEFPASTQDLLSVTFYDRNGDIELARFNQPFTTGANAAESLRIAAEQFDADLFDTDEDGASNLNELIAGTDPLVDEISLLPIFDAFNHSQWSRMSVSRHFESHISGERPFIDTLSLTPREGHTIYRDAIIDEKGNGTPTYNIWAGSISLNITGTRTVSEGAVSWEGVRRARDDYSHRVVVNNTVTYIDANTRAFVEEVEGSNTGTYSDTWETSSNLIGRLIEGTSLCEPIAGTVTTTNRSNRGDSDNYTVTISKGVEDQYWRVGSGTNGYFARDLNMLRSYCGTTCGTYTEPEPDDKYFTCDFVDY